MPRISASEREATRQRLLNAGKQEFAERGLAGARFDEISLAAGHAKGTIYNYFDSKEALFFTVVDEWCAQLIDAFVVPEDATAREQLLALAAIDVEIARKDRDLARVVVQQMPALLGSHAESTLRAIRPGVELLTDIFDHGLTNAEFSSSHGPAVLARLFLDALSAYEMEALVPDPIIQLDDVVELLDQHFVKGLR